MRQSAFCRIIIIIFKPDIAIKKNRAVKDSPYNDMMFEREARVLEMLIEEGFIK